MFFSKRQLEFAQSYVQLRIIPALGKAMYYAALLASFIGARKLYSRLILASIRYNFDSRSVNHFCASYHTGKLNLSDALSTPCAKEDALSRAIVLSNPIRHRDRTEKGVILLSFSHTFSFFLNHPYWDTLNRHFLFVLEPSWSGYADPDILEFIRRSEHCIVQASEIRDRYLINSAFPQTPCLDIGASNWVDYLKFDPTNLSENKVYDAIYIANSNPIKRVFRAIDLFGEAVRIDKQFTAVVVCASWGKISTEEYQQYAEKKGLTKNVKILPGMPQEDLINLASKCKCSILLSLKEGSNRVLFESMFLNLPTLCLSENIGVNKSYINELTGVLTTDGMAVNALLSLKENHCRYSPRNWALQNISPEITTRRLEEVIRIKYNNQINSTLFTKVNSPEVQYMNNTLSKEKIINELFEKIENSGSEFLERYSTQF